MNTKSYADTAREQEEHDLRMQMRAQMLVRQGTIDANGNVPPLRATGWYWVQISDAPGWHAGHWNAEQKYWEVAGYPALPFNHVVKVGEELKCPAA